VAVVRARPVRGWPGPLPRCPPGRIPAGCPTAPPRVPSRGTPGPEAPSKTPRHCAGRSKCYAVQQLQRRRIGLENRGRPRLRPRPHRLLPRLCPGCLSPACSPAPTPWQCEGRTHLGSGHGSAALQTAAGLARSAPMRGSSWRRYAWWVSTMCSQRAASGPMSSRSPGVVRRHQLGRAGGGPLPGPAPRAHASAGGNLPPQQ
jgi:hypothetical protein